MKPKQKRLPKINKRKFTTVSMVYCELLLWSKKNIYLADKEFDDVIKSIFLTAKRRLKKASQAKRKAIEYYEHLNNKVADSAFKPIVTSANGDQNIFQNRNENLNDEDIYPIVEENSLDHNEGEGDLDRENKTFERLYSKNLENNNEEASDPFGSGNNFK